MLRFGGAALMLASAASASYAESGPFSNLNGAWSGTGTVMLSDGSKERIRCRAQYHVGDNGHALKQSLRCASDSYRFDLSSDVTAQGGRVVGTWGEASRNLYGNLQGRVSGNEINVFVTAAGFAGNLSVTTRGNRQSVTIDSKGDLRGVSITMSRSG
jgi:hypothetical protein